MKEQETVITREILEAVNYGIDLKKKFEEIGIESAWKPGKKKSELIDTALKMLDEAAILKAKGLEEEEIQEALKLQAAEEAEVRDKEKKAKKKEADEIKKDKRRSTAAICKDLSTEILLSNLRSIKACLQSGVPAQRDTLTIKYEVIEAELDSRK